MGREAMMRSRLARGNANLPKRPDIGLLQAEKAAAEKAAAESESRARAAVSASEFIRDLGAERDAAVDKARELANTLLTVKASGSELQSQVDSLTVSLNVSEAKVKELETVSDSLKKDLETVQAAYAAYRVSSDAERAALQAACTDQTETQRQTILRLESELAALKA